MFTRLFGKSSFFSYALILGVFVGVFFFQKSTFPFSVETQFQQTLETITFFVLLFLFLGLDWIVRIQYWNEKAIYHLFLFCLLYFIAPLKAIGVWQLLSLFFFWIGFIQILGLDKKNNFIKSVFNGSLWMTISGLFINTNFFLFPLIWGVLFFYNSLSFRSFLISLLPAFALLILGQLIEIFIPTRWFNAFPFFEFQWNLPDFSSVDESVLFFTLAIFFILVWIYHYRSFSHKGGQYLSSIYSLLLVFFVSLAFWAFIDSKEGVSFLLVALSFSALSGPYLENLKQKWVRELILSLLLAVAIYYRAEILGIQTY